ncbi:MAG TPA: DUF58 domain-containing protein [Vicinamibacterales bacterium]|nr:DUF58 domain-containing protein [Vicinamibacterales bacterium]
MEQTQAMAGARFVDPKVLARLNSLELVARTVVDGFINGLHRAPHLGFSLDFAEHRGYEPGDDLRRVDWRLYARTDRFYVKQFEADSNANLVVVLDVSASMRFGSRGLPKIDYGRYLAASLLYFSHQQRDRVGLVTFDRRIVSYVPPSAKHLDFALFALDRAEAGREGELAAPLLTATERLRRRGIVVVVSDLYEEPDRVAAAVRPLRFRGHDVIVFHLLDPAERDFPFDEASSFEDLESGERLPVVPEALRAEYQELVRRHIEALGRLLLDSRVDYALLDTSVPLDFALFRYLAARERLRRVR